MRGYGRHFAQYIVKTQTRLKRNFSIIQGEAVGTRGCVWIGAQKLEEARWAFSGVSRTRIRYGTQLHLPFGARAKQRECQNHIQIITSTWRNSLRISCAGRIHAEHFKVLNDVFNAIQVFQTPS